MARAINVSHISYQVSDLHRCQEFFTEALGFYPQERGRISYVGLGETLIELVHRDFGPQDPNVYVFGVLVEDLVATIEDLETRGAKVVKPIWEGASFWGRQAVIDVPGGQQIALREYRAPDGPHFTDWKAEG